MHMQTGRQLSFAKYILEQVKVWKRTILINGIKLYTCKNRQWKMSEGV